MKNLNHAALEAADPLGLTDFYTRVLGFKSINRPNLPFEGSWLEGAGLLVHIIQEDPSVPKRIRNWKVRFPSDVASVAPGSCISNMWNTLVCRISILSNLLKVGIFGVPTIWVSSLMQTHDTCKSAACLFVFACNAEQQCISAGHAAFEAEDSDAMEERLVHFGIEYTKAIVPGVDVAQLFFFDPEG